MQEARSKQQYNDDAFVSYLEQEYSYIAEAHFKTIETISTFFKNYIALMTIPIALIAYLFSKAENINFLTSSLILQIYGGIFLLVISCAGLMVMIYIINLRHDALLYARTVNGIRKYFYDRASVDINTKLRMRTLPQSSVIPAYNEARYFIPVIVSFSVLNSFYYAVGYYALLHCVQFTWYSILFTLFSSSLFFCLHFIFYLSYSRYREREYLRSNIIGIDIDGVLNKHREQFCVLLKENTGKDIEPNDIIHMPVHELGITTTEDDNKVFNDPQYWITMPLIEDSSKNILKLRNYFKLKVFIFTHRGWPDLKPFSKEAKAKISDAWRSAFGDYEKEVSKLIYKKSLYSLYYKIKKFIDLVFNRSTIERITELWLKKHNIEYDKLIIEKSTENTTDPKGDYQNRFQWSRKRKIKYFVEDDLEKAIKLSFICDVVFLFDHPYNQEKKFLDISIPSNIIRIKSWNDIYRTIRKIS